MSGRITQQYLEAAVSGDGTQAARVTQQYVEVAAAPLPQYIPAVSPAYLAAAKQARQGRREPVVAVRIEDVATLERTYTTQGDWNGSAVNVNLDSTIDVGSITPNVLETLATNGAVQTLTAGLNAGQTNTAYRALSFATNAYATFPYTVQGFKLKSVPYAHEYPNGTGFPPLSSSVRRIRVDIRSSSYTGTIVASTKEYDVTFTKKNWQVVLSGTFYSMEAVSPLMEFELATGNELSASTTYYLTWAFIGYDSNVVGMETAAGKLKLTPKSAANSTLTTSTIDLGEIPATASIFSADDVKPSGSAIVYTAYADNFSPPTTSRGTVVDGGTIGAAGYRYYRIKADFSSTTGARAILQELRIAGGDYQFKLYSTHKDLPSVGALPLLPPNPVGSLSSKIEIDKPTSVGEMSFKLLWTKETGDLLATGFLRNKAIQILHGYVGLAVTDYVTLFTGTWANYKADHKKRIIDVSTQNVLKKFMKVKLPRETFNGATGVKETDPLVFAAANAIQVILDLVDELGIPDRYIDRTTIEGLRDGAFASADYNVTRTIANPEEAWTLIHQLATVCGCFVVVLPDGKMSLVQYDEEATPVATLDARFVDFGVINGGQDGLFTRQLIYYDPNNADPGDDEGDYDKGLLAINATSETAYDESTEHRWFDKWNCSTAVITALATRWDSWQGTPRFTIPAKNVPGHMLDILEGQIVTVTGLTIPTPDYYFDVPQAFKALVMKRSFDVKTCTLDFDLMQIADAEQAEIPLFSTSFDPTKKGTSVVLSNSDLTATFNDVSILRSALVLDGKTTGRWMARVSMVSGAATNPQIGVVDSAKDVNTSAGKLTDGVGWRGDGYMYTNNVNYLDAARSYGNGDIVTIEIDADLRKARASVDDGVSWSAWSPTLTGTGALHVAVSGLNTSSNPSVFTLI